MNKKELSKEQIIENAIKLMTEKFSVCKDLIKPTVFHCVRVGTHLYDKDYSTEICVAGVLHDTLEDTSLTEREIETLFGKHVAELVRVNTQDDTVPKEERKRELITRCAKHSEEALIIKSADILDNFRYYSRQSNESEIKRCRMLAGLIKECRKEDQNDPLIQEVIKLVEKR